MLVGFLTDEQAEAYEAFAQEPRHPELERFLLRTGTAGHPNITDALLEHLLTDPGPKVADAAAANAWVLGHSGGHL